jgi:peptide/nickel transport system permease protein
MNSISTPTTTLRARRAALSPLARFWARFAESRLALIGLALCCIVLLLAIFAPYIAPQNPYDPRALNILDGRLPPGSASMEGRIYWLGTDTQGRDILSAILYGLRISLGVGVLSTIFALAIGTALGLLAAYFGGRVDSIVMRAVDIQLGFPSILVALILLSALGKGVDKIIVALVIVQWAYYARAVRGTALVERQKGYMEAARCLALPHRDIVLAHLLPNCMPPLIVVVTVQVAHAIALEATLSFLGVGLPISEPSLGLLIANGFQFMLSGKYWVSLFPGLALLVIIVAINLVGDQIRDVVNPRLQH